jgi:hypothetical protein
MANGREESEVTGDKRSGTGYSQAFCVAVACRGPISNSHGARSFNKDFWRLGFFFAFPPAAFIIKWNEAHRPQISSNGGKT